MAENPDTVDMQALQACLGADFSPQALERLRALDPSGGAGLIGRLFALYADVLHTQCTAVEHGVRQSSHDEVRRAAHSLRSSSLSIGAEDFAQRCLELERRVMADPSVQANLDQEVQDWLAQARRVASSVGQALDLLNAEGKRP